VSELSEIEGEVAAIGSFDRAARSGVRSNSHQPKQKIRSAKVFEQPGS
jgi:hypothetical protein